MTLSKEFLTEIRQFAKDHELEEKTICGETMLFLPDNPHFGIMFISNDDGRLIFRFRVIADIEGLSSYEIATSLPSGYDNFRTFAPHRAKQMIKALEKLLPDFCGFAEMTQDIIDTHQRFQQSYRDAAKTIVHKYFKVGKTDSKDTGTEISFPYLYAKGMYFRELRISANTARLFLDSVDHRLAAKIMKVIADYQEEVA